jgi:hypothetical protein
MLRPTFGSRHMRIKLPICAFIATFAVCGIIFQKVDIARSQTGIGSAMSIEIARPEIARPEIWKPEVSKPEIANVEIAKPDISGVDRMSWPEAPDIPDLVSRAAPTCEKEVAKEYAKRRPETYDRAQALQNIGIYAGDVRRKRPGGPVLVAITLTNKNQFAIKDIQVKCTYRDADQNEFQKELTISETIGYSGGSGPTCQHRSDSSRLNSTELGDLPKSFTWDGCVVTGFELWQENDRIHERF